MEELLKFVSALPLPAALSFGAVLAVIVAITRMGILEGRKSSPEHDAPAAQVAAVIVDPTALNNATAAMNRNAAAMERIADIGDKLVAEFERIREEIRDLSREISRRN